MVSTTRSNSFIPSPPKYENFQVSPIRNCSSRWSYKYLLSSKQIVVHDSIFSKFPPSGNTSQIDLSADGCWMFQRALGYVWGHTHNSCLQLAKPVESNHWFCINSVCTLEQWSPNWRPLHSEKALCPDQHSLFHCAVTFLLDLGTGMLWAVEFIAQCPSRLCSWITRQIQLPRASLCWNWVGNKAAVQHNGKCCSRVGGLSPNTRYSLRAIVWWDLPLNISNTLLFYYYYNNGKLQER